jgi:hypothetical protein
MDDLKKMLGSFGKLQEELDAITKDIKPFKDAAEKVLKQPKVKKARTAIVGEVDTEVILFEDNSIKIVPVNREQADRLFTEIHLYKKPISLLNACRSYLSKILR